MRLAHVGDEIWIGDYHACDRRSGLFDLTIHVWRGRDRDEGQWCRQMQSGDVDGIEARWGEGEKLDTLTTPFADLMEYAARPGRLLIHCRGGICRSAKLAVAAKVARGCDVWQAIADVSRGVWRSYREPVWLEHGAMREIIEWAEEQGRG